MPLAPSACASAPRVPAAFAEISETKPDYSHSSHPARQASSKPSHPRPAPAATPDSEPGRARRQTYTLRCGTPGCTGRLRKEFILIDQLQPRERIVSPPEVQRRFQQVAVQIRVDREFVHASPYEASSPSCPQPAAGCIPPKPSAATDSPAPALPDAPAVQCCTAPSSCSWAQQRPARTTNPAPPVECSSVLRSARGR